MPIYQYRCESCGTEREVIKPIWADRPVCCGKPMSQVPVAPAVIRVRGTNGVKTFSKGYKEGYARDYQKDVPPFEPGDAGAKLAAPKRPLKKLGG